MQSPRQLIEKIDALSLRERGVLCIGLLFILYFVWDVLLIRPLEVKQNQVNSDIQLRNAEVIVANTELQSLLKQADNDPNAENKKKLGELRQTMITIEGKLKQITSHMVAPENMARALETVLQSSGGLRLIQLKGLGSSPLLAEAQNQANNVSIGRQVETELPGEDTDTISTAFKHGFQVTIGGDYFGTLHFLERLETLDWKFYWDSIEYKVAEYPGATSTISVYTVSLNPNWIGI